MKKQWGILLISLMIVTLSAGCQLNKSNAAVAAVRATQITGYAVTDANGNGIGVVKGLVVDSKNGAITYALVELPQPPFYGKATAIRPDDLVAIPWDELRLEAEKKTLVFKGDKVIVQGAPRLADLPDTLAAGWDNEIHRYWWPLPDR